MMTLIAIAKKTVTRGFATIGSALSSIGSAKTPTAAVGKTTARVACGRQFPTHEHSDLNGHSISLPNTTPMFQRLYRALLGHPVARWVVILGSLLYLISPIDLSPDVIPILGWVDDGVLATLMAAGITEVVLDRRRQVKARRERREQQPNGK